MSRFDPWPATIADAEAAQRRLRPLLNLSDPGPRTVRYVAGLDVAYGAEDEEVSGAVVVLRADTLEIADRVVVRERPRFPYVPGLFAFRELPPLLVALDQVKIRPDLLVCDDIVDVSALRSRADRDRVKAFFRENLRPGLPSGRTHRPAHYRRRQDPLRRPERRPRPRPWCVVTDPA